MIAELAVGGAEGVHHEHVAQRREFAAKGLVVRKFARLEADVLQQADVDYLSNLKRQRIKTKLRKQAPGKTRG